MHSYHDDRMDWILGGDKVHPAVVAMEGFDHMNAGLVNGKNGWNGNFAAMVAGRFEGQAGSVNNGASGATRARPLPSTYSELFCGVAFIATTPANNEIFILLQGGIAGSRVISINIDGSNKLTLKNSAGTVIGTGTTTLSSGTFYYAELHAKVNGASGIAELRLNGSSEIASFTTNIGSTNIDAFAVSSTQNPVISFDDIYLVDTTGGSPFDTFLGDVRIATRMATADGAHTAWSPSGGGSHYNKVNEITGTFPDGDTTYVSDSSVGDIDSYVFADVDGGATVFAVQLNMYARKDDANTRQIAPLIRQSATDYVGNTDTLGSGYQWFSQLYPLDPTSTAWTPSTVNADEYGVKVIA